MLLNTPPCTHAQLTDFSQLSVGFFASLAHAQWSASRTWIGPWKAEFHVWIPWICTLLVQMVPRLKLRHAFFYTKSRLYINHVVQTSIWTTWTLDPRRQRKKDERETRATRTRPSNSRFVLGGVYCHVKFGSYFAKFG